VVPVEPVEPLVVPPGVVADVPPVVPVVPPVLPGATVATGGFVPAPVVL
jgi:hypothetical protein